MDVRRTGCVMSRERAKELLCGAHQDRIQRLNHKAPESFDEFYGDMDEVVHALMYRRYSVAEAQHEFEQLLRAWELCTALVKTPTAQAQLDVVSRRPLSDD